MSWDYPDGMKLANNDDHRWEIFHQAWMDSMPIIMATFPTQASTITRGYDVADSMVVDDYIDYRSYFFGYRTVLSKTPLVETTRLDQDTSSWAVTLG